MNKVHELVKEAQQLRLENAQLRKTNAGLEHFIQRLRSEREQDNRSWQATYDNQRREVTRLQKLIVDYRETISQLSAKLDRFKPVFWRVG